MKKRIVVIGAGPAGLAFAYKLLKSKNKDYEVIILEKEEINGGLSKTIKYKNQYIDIGGHRFLQDNMEVVDFYKEIADGNESIIREKEKKCRIYYKKKFYNYPIQLEISTLMKLGILESFFVACSYLKTKIIQQKGKTLEDFYKNQFGKNYT